MWLLPPRLTPQLGGAQHSACAPRLMTAPSQSRPTTMFAMSGLAPIATVMLQCHDRSKSANRRHQACLFDHLVGAGEERRWHSNAKRLGGFHIDDQLETSWLLDRQIGGLGAL